MRIVVIPKPLALFYIVLLAEHSAFQQHSPKQILNMFRMASFSRVWLKPRNPNGEDCLHPRLPTSITLCERKAQAWTLWSIAA